MSKDTIYREDAIEVLAINAPFMSDEAYLKSYDALKSLPSADRPQGKWIDKTVPVSKANPYGGIIVGVECSVCGYDGEDEQLGKISHRIIRRFHFCPNCGMDTRIKGADDDTDNV